MKFHRLLVLQGASVLYLLLLTQHSDATRHSHGPSDASTGTRPSRRLSTSTESRRVTQQTPEEVWWSPQGCTENCQHERSLELNRRFVRHFRSLLLNSPRHVANRAASSGSWYSWPRELACEPGCLHEGVCQLDAKTKDPICLCPPPDPTSGVYFRGRSCQTEAVRCNSTWWCENGGTCLHQDGRDIGCSCPSKFQGLKCQTPVTPCGDAPGDLWCANGGVCLFSLEANGTICKCPSTHAGTNCEKLVEPQDLGVVHRDGSNFTFKSPVVMPTSSDVELLQDEQARYFKTFFLIFGVFLTIWVTALAAVHCPRPRNELKRRLRVLRGELTPLKDAASQKDKAILTRVKIVERLSKNHSMRKAVEPQKHTGDATSGAEGNQGREMLLDGSTPQSHEESVRPDGSAHMVVVEPITAAPEQDECSLLTSTTSSHSTREARDEAVVLSRHASDPGQGPLL